MQRKFLEDLGLTKEQIDSIMAVNGDDINKAKGDIEDVKTQLKTAQDTIKERDTQIEGLKKIDAEGLQAKITELQEANKQATEKYNTEMAELKLSNALKLAVTDAQDLDLVIGQLDKQKLKLDENGVLTGLDEQLKPLRESKSFLFKQEQQPNIGGFKPNVGNKDIPQTEMEAMTAEIDQYFK